MAANNVFQMLAQQEIDKPARRLQELQIQQQEMQTQRAMAEQAYQQKAQTDLAAMPQSTQATQTLGSMGPQGLPFSPEAPQMASMDPNAQGNKLSAMGLNINPMRQTETKPLTIADQFKQQYDYHMQNGRSDLAQGVMEHQLELSEKAAKVADHAYKTGGREGLASWLKNNPTFAPLLGDPAHMQLGKEGVLYPAAGPDGVPVPGEFWYRDENGKVAFKTIKPQVDQEALLDKRFANQQTLQAQQIAAQDRRSSAQISAQDRRTSQQIAASDRRAAQTANGGGLGKLDIESAKVLIRTLPKLKEEAVAANGSIDRIDTMMTLVKGGVGGKKGQILSTLAPYAELAGVNTKAMNDAQTYEIMAKTIGGSMRMQIVGPGPVSNYENQLLQKISGGGMAATPAATELLSYYRKMAKEKVDDYNGSVDSVSEFSPATRKIYRKVGSAAPTTAVASSRPAPKLSKAAAAVDKRY